MDCRSILLIELALGVILIELLFDHLQEMEVLWDFQVSLAYVER